jgi:hypothetical protein
MIITCRMVTAIGQHNCVRRRKRLGCGAGAGCDSAAPGSRSAESGISLRQGHKSLDGLMSGTERHNFHRSRRDGRDVRSRIPTSLVQSDCHCTGCTQFHTANNWRFFLARKDKSIMTVVPLNLSILCFCSTLCTRFIIDFLSVPELAPTSSTTTW